MNSKLFAIAVFFLVFCSFVGKPVQVQAIIISSGTCPVGAYCINQPPLCPLGAFCPVVSPVPFPGDATTTPIHINASPLIFVTPTDPNQNPITPTTTAPLPSSVTIPSGNFWPGIPFTLVVGNTASQKGYGLPGYISGISVTLNSVSSGSATVILISPQPSCQETGCASVQYPPQTIQLNIGQTVSPDGWPANTLTLNSLTTSSATFTVNQTSTTETTTCPLGAYCVNQNLVPPPGQSAGTPGTNQNNSQANVTAAAANAPARSMGSPAGSVLCSLSRSLLLGMSGPEVSCLQKILSQYPSIYPQGLVTGYYGSLTQAAVERFQAQQGLVSSGSAKTTGYGIVGPRTLKLLVR